MQHFVILTSVDVNLLLSLSNPLAKNAAITVLPLEGG